jgi:DNA-binding response OmpR family regulator
MKLLMLEDDSTIAFAVKTYLDRQGMETDVFYKLSDLENINIKDYDLMILDVNLPDGSGFSYLEYIREFSDIPAIMLTVKKEDSYVLEGFSKGADDYLAKPFSLPVLKARIDNILKRKNLGEKNIVFEDLKLDFTSKTARIAENTLDLNRQEFELLWLLLENKDMNLTRQKIIDSVWGYDYNQVNDNTLTVSIKRLRKKLLSYSSHIKTVRGIGYKWESGEK